MGNRTDAVVAVLGHRLASLSAFSRVLVSLLLLAGVAVLNMTAGREIGFSIFYLIPVTFAGGLISRRAGLALAVLSAVTWGYLEITMGPAYSASWIPYWNSAVRFGFFLIVNELIDGLRRAHLRERAFARTDSLTGIANGRVFREHVERVLAGIRRHGRPVTLAFIDVDGFKRVNDEFGHSEGDQLLREVARIMAHGARHADVVARLGGDEFGILMPDTDAERARAMLQRMSTAIAEHVSRYRAAGTSIGAVTFNEPPGDVDVAIRLADGLMYRGKTAGRGRIVQATWPESSDASDEDGQ